MTKLKLVDGTTINTESMEIVKGMLRITTSDLTVEELADIFSDKEKTNLITMYTESDVEIGFRTGFTSFAGIVYDADGVKTIELFQPKDVTEARLANVEGMANIANNAAMAANNEAVNANNAADVLEVDLVDTQLALVENYNMSVAIAEEITDVQLALVEIYDMISTMTGGAE